MLTNTNDDSLSHMLDLRMLMSLNNPDTRVQIANNFYTWLVLIFLIFFMQQMEADDKMQWRGFVLWLWS